jgi:hypothetical protein
MPFRFWSLRPQFCNKLIEMSKRTQKSINFSVAGAGFYDFTLHLHGFLMELWLKRAREKKSSSCELKIKSFYDSPSNKKPIFRAYTVKTYYGARGPAMLKQSFYMHKFSETISIHFLLFLFTIIKVNRIYSK